jgi:integrase
MKKENKAKTSPATPVFDATRKRWRVSLPASKNPNGKRVRSWHSSRDAAREYIASIVSGTEPSAVIPPKLALKADEARLILEPHGLDLVEAAKLVASLFDALGGSGTPLEAARAWRLANDQRSSSKTFLEAKDLFMISRDGLREDTLRGYRQYLKNVFSPLHSRTLSDIKVEEISECIAHLPPPSKKGAQTTLGVFWRWSAMQPRQWCDVGLLESLEPVRISREKDICTLGPEDVRALLAAAESTSPGCAVAFAVAIFGGVRLRELEKITWKEISTSHIEITAAIAKRHSRRLVPICSTLKSWLDTYRGKSGDDDLIVGPNWVNTSKVARRKAGWAVVTQPPLSGLEDPKRGSWPQNCMRHTCASIQVAIGKPLEDLIFSFGHSGGSNLLKQHYLGQLTKKDALKILSIGPNDSRISNLSVA